MTRIEALKFSSNPHHKFDFDWQHERAMEFQQVFDLNKSPKTTPENNEINNTDVVTEEIPVAVAGRAPDKEARPADVQEVRIGYFSSTHIFPTSSLLSEERNSFFLDSAPLKSLV